MWGSMWGWGAGLGEGDAGWHGWGMMGLRMEWMRAMGGWKWDVLTVARVWACAEGTRRIGFSRAHPVAWTWADDLDGVYIGCWMTIKHLLRAPLVQLPPSCACQFTQMEPKKCFVGSAGSAPRHLVHLAMLAHLISTAGSTRGNVTGNPHAGVSRFLGTRWMRSARRSSCSRR